MSAPDAHAPLEAARVLVAAMLVDPRVAPDIADDAVIAQASATLALAEEQRTANLLALLEVARGGLIAGTGTTLRLEAARRIVDDVLDRLGFDT